MTNVNIIAAVIGAVLSITIVLLTRKDHISPLVAARWFIIAIMVLFVSFFPNVVDLIGAKLGIGYPPVLPIIIALGAAMIKILLMDVERQKLNTKLNRVVQRMAILESAIESQRSIETNTNSNNGTERQK